MDILNDHAKRIAPTTVARMSNNAKPKMRVECTPCPGTPRAFAKGHGM